MTENENPPVTDENRPNSTVDQLETILGQLTVNQIRFVIARQNAPSDRRAAEEIGLSPAAVKLWKQEGAPIDEAVRLMVADGLTTALHLRRRNLGKAMAVKVAGLECGDERLRQNVATEIIEWELGRAVQRQEVGGRDGEAILIRVDR